MKGHWKFFVFGLLLFQWVQALVFWHLLDVIRLQAEGSWLHETVWGPETMRWTWIIGGIVSAVAILLLFIDVRTAVAADMAKPHEPPPPR